MTISNRIKSELFIAEVNYQDALEALRNEYPHGVYLIGERVDTKAATLYARLQRAEAALTALQSLVNYKMNINDLDIACNRIVKDWNNAESDNEIEAAEKEYYSLFSIKAK